MASFPLFLRRGIGALDRLKKHHLGESLLETFKGFVRRAQDRELFRVNPRHLAASLGWSEPQTLDVLALSIAEKLWTLEWETHCSHCGLALQSTESLADLQTHHQCEECHMESEVSLDQEIVVRASLDKRVRRLRPDRRDDPDFRAEVDARLGPLPALKLINRPIFRDLLGEQTLPPNQSLGIDNLAIFFSDLKSSTALYQRLGDARAYELVRRHFEVVFEAVDRHGGAAVKTIGDGVMGTFFNNTDALRGIAASVAGIQALNERAGLSEEECLSLKVGLHAGPCIVVTMNQRLDYFGSTVNIAARLSDLAQGDDLVFSRVVLEDPQAHELIQELGYLKGLDAQLRGLVHPMSLLRLELKKSE